jgi:hypothetical protein
MTNNEAGSIPRKMRDRYEAIISITDEFCGAYLNQEYAALSRRMTATLSGKRPSPLESGQAKSWAAGVLYTLARVNFLFDADQDPHMTATELCERIGVSQSTATSKSNQVWDRLDLVQLDPKWCLPTLLADNPLAWMILVDGQIADARSLPTEIQEEAHRLGLIPYLP